MAAFELGCRSDRQRTFPAPGGGRLLFRWDCQFCWVEGLTYIPRAEPVIIAVRGAILMVFWSVCWEYLREGVRDLERGRGLD